MQQPKPQKRNMKRQIKSYVVVSIDKNKNEPLLGILETLDASYSFDSFSDALDKARELETSNPDVFTTVLNTCILKDFHRYIVRVEFIDDKIGHQDIPSDSANILPERCPITNELRFTIPDRANFPWSLIKYVRVFDFETYYNME